MWNICGTYVEHQCLAWLGQNQRNLADPSLFNLNTTVVSSTCGCLTRLPTSSWMKCAKWYKMIPRDFDSQNVERDGASPPNPRNPCSLTANSRISRVSLFALLITGHRAPPADTGRPEKTWDQNWSKRLLFGISGMRFKGSPWITSSCLLCKTSIKGDRWDSHWFSFGTVQLQ